MKKLSETPRTDEVPHNVAELAMHARKLERELAELKAIHKTAITDCQQYTPERWKELCAVQEPAAVWLDGKQMTELMQDKEARITAECHEIHEVKYKPKAL